MTVRIGSLFSGYGGLDLAVEQATGGTTAWVSDVDKGACKVLAHRFPDAPNIGDITKVDWAALEPVDIITGGSPCQDLSHAGRRAGMTDGTRSNLWVQMRESIAVIRPSYVVWENVRGAYTAPADSDLEPCPGCVGDDPGVVLRALGRVLGDLADLGYDAAWHGLRAADVGAPHGRFRVFVLAWLTDAAGDEGWIRHRDDVPPGAAGQLLPTPRTSDTNGAGAHGDGGIDLRIAVTLLPTPTSQPEAMGNPEAREARVQRAREKHGRPFGESLSSALTDTAAWGDYAAAITRWERVLGRPAPAPTITSAKGNPQLSPRFVEWLIGLDEGHVCDVPDLTRNEQLKLLGNGVVPQQALAALHTLDWIRTEGAA